MAAPAAPARNRHPVLFSLWVGVVLVVALAMILFLVLPTRTWWAQRTTMSDTAGRLAAITEENEALTARVKALQAPGEIERVARSQYGMIRPGERPFAVLPPTPPQVLPTSWPYSVLQGILDARGIPGPAPPGG